MIDQQQAKFEGYGLVEIMGHQRVAGFVTTEYFGNVAVFHVVMGSGSVSISFEINYLEVPRGTA